MKSESEKVAKGEATRARLVAAAAEMMQADGIASITARKLADKVGLKRQIVHFYFGTIDDLLLEVMKTGFSVTCKTVAAELAHRDPVEVIWNQFARATPESAEFTALALRNDAFAGVLSEFSGEMHRLFAEAIDADYRQRGIEPPAPPSVLALIIQATAQSLGWEAAVGPTAGHEQVKSALNAFLQRS